MLCVWLVLGRLGLMEAVRLVERRKLPRELERARKPIVVCSPFQNSTMYYNEKFFSKIINTVKKLMHYFAQIS